MTIDPIFVSLFTVRSDLDQIASLPDLFEKIKRVVQSGGSTTRIVLDSLTDLTARFQIDEVQKFVAELYDLLKRNCSIGFFAVTGTPSTPPIDAFGSLVDGIIQLRMDDSGDEMERSIRILSLKTAESSPKWVKFKITQEGFFQFEDTNVTQPDLRCKLCNEPIAGTPAKSASGTFHPHCLDTYQKLGAIYGSHVIYALQPGVVDANFFFIDIVGLSNPLMSVEKQIGKIEDLNALIGSCEAYSKVPKDKKIVLPTGDGMAVGFLINPELPLQLSIQLHHKLREFNARMTSDKTIGVRIGLGSGPVFVVSDINNNQNVWGPGIILARRVMDLGDENHILLADNIAEALMNLKDEYRNMIRPISIGIRIKHGQQLRVYSAYSQDFGNPQIPMRIAD